MVAPKEFTREGRAESLASMLLNDARDEHRVKDFRRNENSNVPERVNFFGAGP